MAFKAYVVLNDTTDQYLPTPFKSPVDAEDSITLLLAANPLCEYSIKEFSHDAPEWTFEKFSEWLADVAKKSTH